MKLIVSVISIILLSNSVFAKTGCEERAEKTAIEHVKQKYKETFADVFVRTEIKELNENNFRISIPGYGRTYIVELTVDKKCEKFKINYSNFVE